MINLMEKSTSWQEDVEDTIKLAKDKIIKDKLPTNGGFGYIANYYPFTNENMTKLCNIFKSRIKSGNGLSIAGGGDQILSFCLYGAEDINIIDINKLQYYHLAFKISAIKSLIPKDYLNTIFSLQQGDINHFVNEVINNIQETDARNFWNDIVSKLNVREHRSMAVMVPKYEWLDKTLPYLDTMNYYLLREYIKEITLNFYITNLLNNNIKGKYDFIYYSNILNYLNRSNSTKIIKNTLNHLKKDSIAMVEHGISIRKDLYGSFNNNYKAIKIKEYASYEGPSYLHTFTKK